MSDPHISVRQKREVAQRAGGCCEYCRSQARFSPDPFSVDHIRPRSKGGSNDIANLALSCQGCNSRKYISTEARDPISGQTVALFHPHRDRWADHFTWNHDCTLMIGHTPTGRATIDRLDLNRSALVNLRRILRQAHEHPPR